MSKLTSPALRSEKEIDVELDTGFGAFCSSNIPDAVIPSGTPVSEPAQSVIW
jgi:hypothetical protein